VGVHHRSGYLDSEEVRRLCKKLGMTLGSRELLHTMAIIDTDGDGRVSCREFCTWWDENQGRNKYQLRDCRALFDRLDLDHSGAPPFPAASAALARMCPWVSRCDGCHDAAAYLETVVRWCRLPRSA
jgi:2-hydroxychromene-2-carboxylate isomerase